MGAVYWIESKRGGTFGFPDALVAIKGHLIPAELKRSEAGSYTELWSEDRTVVKRFWKPHLRPSQVAVGRRLFVDGVEALVIVGVRGTDTVVFARLWAAICAQTNGGLVEVRKAEWGEEGPRSFFWMDP